MGRRDERGSMAEFDRIAPVYDETRGPLNRSALDALTRALQRAEARTVVEIGVGTGRVAEPLHRGGWSICGVDLSGEMLRRARAKGLPRLLRADAEHLPFRDASFDAAVLAHVLHVFSDPSAALRETARVCRRRILLLLLTPAEASKGGGGIRQARALFREVRERYGLPPLARPREWWREGALLRAAPPVEIHEFEADERARTLAAWIAGIEKRAYSDIADLPEEALGEIVRELRRRSADWPEPGPRLARVGEWTPDQLRDLAPLERPPAPANAA